MRAARRAGSVVEIGKGEDSFRATSFAEIWIGASTTASFAVADSLTEPSSLRRYTGGIPRSRVKTL
jgi:hypothetical protein